MNEDSQSQCQWIYITKERLGNSPKLRYIHVHLADISSD